MPIYPTLAISIATTGWMDAQPLAEQDAARLTPPASHLQIVGSKVAAQTTGSENPHSLMNGVAVHA